MRPAFFKSLPVRLAGFILLSGGLALLAVTELNRRAVERILVDQSEIQAMLATNAIAEGLDGVMGSVERIARLTARGLEGRPVSADEAGRLARNAMLDQPQIFGFGVAVAPAGEGAARAGVAVYRSGSAAKFTTVDLIETGKEFWERDWYREALERGAPSWSEPFFDAGGTEKNVVRLTVPVWRATADGREPAGAVFALVELEWLSRLANANEFSDSGYTIVFSRSGRIATHPRPVYVVAETIDTLAEKDNAPELAEMRRRVIARKQGAMRYGEAIGGRRLHANYKPSRAVPGWGIIVAYDEAEFLGPLHDFRKYAAGYLGAGLLVLAGIVIGVTRTALRPLGELALAADEIAKRNLDCAVPEPRRADEIGRLAGAFRAMRDALKAQHLERRWAAQALEHQLKYNQLVIDSVGELVFVLTKSLSISRINPAVTRLAGYAEGDVIRAPLTRILSLTRAPDETSDDATVMAGILKENRSVSAAPAKLKTSDGRMLGVRLNLVPLLDQNRVVGAVATLRVDEADLPGGGQGPGREGRIL